MRALRAAELEVAALKAALDVARLKEEAHLRAHAAPVDALGLVVAVTDAPGTLEVDAGPL